MDTNNVFNEIKKITFFEADSKIAIPSIKYTNLDMLKYCASEQARVTKEDSIKKIKKQSFY